MHMGTSACDASFIAAQCTRDIVQAARPNVKLVCTFKLWN